MDWLRRAAKSRPGAPAVIAPDRTYTYAELDRAADAVAEIVAANDRGGSPVAFWGERDAATVAAVWGIPRAGVTAVAIDPGLPPAESMRLTRLAGVRGLWAEPEGGIDSLIERGEGRSPSQQDGATRGRDGGAGALSVGLPAPQLAATPTEARTPPSPSTGEAHGGSRPTASYVLFTSGTSGPRKGVVLTDHNVATAVEASQQRLGNGPDDPWLAVLPLHHVGGLSILWRQAAAGAPVVLHPTFDPAAAATALSAGGFASVVPTMLRRMLAAGARGHAGLRGVLVGGGPADLGLLKAARDAGLPVLQTYGMTETCSQVCTVAPGEGDEALGTAGRPLPGAEVAIEPDGRIRVRGPMVSPGYLGEPPRREEWFVTGDRGRLDDAGRLVVLGRADRVIVTGGENVQPETVEAVLRSVPGVTAVRVSGEPDPEWGQRVVAEVVLAGVGVDAVEAAARPRLTRAELPREWRIVESVPAKLE